jgi:hypothetical protein
MKLCALLAASLLLTHTFAAQEADEPARGPDGGTRFHVDGIQIRPVAGKPFSGRDNIEWTRTLEDGSVVKTHLYADLARDSQGRIYRENRKFVPGDSDQEPRQIDLTISDPVTHTRTTCIIARHQCTITSYFVSTTFTPQPAGAFDKGTRFLARESLGTDTFDGLNVVGTRETTTINAGVVGNSQPLVTTREFWYSPDLQVNLSVTRKDPRNGTQVIRVVDLSRTEPDAAMFQVPAGFIVQDARRGSVKIEN